MTAIFVILAAVVVSIRSGSFAAWLWKNNMKLSSFGVWLITFSMLVVSVVFGQM